MQSVLNSLVLASAESGENASHAGAILIGALIFGVLMLLMVVTMAFSNAAHRHPQTPARIDPHRSVHSRDSHH
ncbi:hypothetical protein [Falsarthrobacter nasiphocae]|uniref:Uncharacterized protein n=1 Tax=Falsarthrobacter nasiphocae TaxID=189863 RepID=A0AAE4C644_9MICC|nr:hypothetical protein [Falsarthrobacter nasiphocae]MDR6892941.1 hypothetical protein [Falsarthrobacter nasiphocae]